jgi:hypothetical protein
MCSLHQLNAFAASSRGEGLHPKLRALLERAAASPFRRSRCAMMVRFRLGQIRSRKS